MFPIYQKSRRNGNGFLMTSSSTTKASCRKKKERGVIFIMNILKSVSFKILDWFEELFLHSAQWYIWVILILSLAGNLFQYTFHKGYDQNVSFVINAYEEEQLENFDLNRAIHEKNLIILDLNWTLNECKSMLQIIEEETDGSIAVKHILEND